MLPSLPQQKNKREARWTTTVFKKWLEKRGITGAFEIKFCKTNAMPFSDVKPHQVQNLLMVRRSTFVYKIPDMGERAPFDLFSMTEEPAHIVIKYPKGFVLISIDQFVLEGRRSKRRSLTWSRAKEIAWEVVD